MVLQPPKGFFKLSVIFKSCLMILSYSFKQPIIITTDSSGGRLLLRENTGIARFITNEHAGGPPS